MWSLCFTQRGGSAREALLIEKLDIILLDIMMPGLDGIGFAGKVIRESIHCPIVSRPS